MARSFQVTVDCLDVATQAAFWSAALHYETLAAPSGYRSWAAFFESKGLPVPDDGSFAVLIDPDGQGPQLYLQRVSEAKSAKNRMHLDLQVAADERSAEVERLCGLGATAGDRHTMDPTDPDAYWVVMQDPEGNEFCIGS